MLLFACLVFSRIYRRSFFFLSKRNTSWRSEMSSSKLLDSLETSVKSLKREKACLEQKLRNMISQKKSLQAKVKGTVTRRNQVTSPKISTVHVTPAPFIFKRRALLTSRCGTPWSPDMGHHDLHQCGPHDLLMWAPVTWCGPRVLMWSPLSWSRPPWPDVGPHDLLIWVPLTWCGP